MQGMLLKTPMTPMDAKQKNPLALAFMGDTIWDLLTRQQLLSSAARVNALHKSAISRVNAGAQAAALDRMAPYLNDEEADIMRRGLNAHAKHSVPKNQDPMDYSKATGLEAVFGYLYLTGQNDRICELFDISEAIN